MFNPFLSEEGTVKLAEAVGLWLRLCALEDKLGRLERWTGATVSEALVRREMQVMKCRVSHIIEFAEGASSEVTPMFIEA